MREPRLSEAPPPSRLSHPEKTSWYQANFDVEIPSSTWGLLSRGEKQCRNLAVFIAPVFRN